MSPNSRPHNQPHKRAIIGPACGVLERAHGRAPGQAASQTRGRGVAGTARSGAGQVTPSPVGDAAPDKCDRKRAPDAARRAERRRGTGGCGEAPRSPDHPRGRPYWRVLASRCHMPRRGVPRPGVFLSGAMLEILCAKFAPVVERAPINHTRQPLRQGRAPDNVDRQQRTDGREEGPDPADGSR